MLKGANWGNTYDLTKLHLCANEQHPTLLKGLMEEVSEQYAGGNILDAGCHDCISGSVDASATAAGAAAFLRVWHSVTAHTAAAS
jgi:hypothetical protein